MMERSTSKITLAESVYERIRRDIITNQLKPGEKINIRELSTRYEASETPNRLAQCGGQPGDRAPADPGFPS